MKTGVSLVRIQTEELTAEHPDVAVRCKPLKRRTKGSLGLFLFLPFG